MLDCWKANPLERPSFMELAHTFTQMITPVTQFDNASPEQSDGTSVYQPAALFTYILAADVNYNCS
jgi:hypothetical protein